MLLIVFLIYASRRAERLAHVSGKQGDDFFIGRASRYGCRRRRRAKAGIARYCIYRIVWIYPGVARYTADRPSLLIDGPGVAGRLLTVIHLPIRNEGHVDVVIRASNLSPTGGRCDIIRTTVNYRDTGEHEISLRSGGGVEGKLRIRDVRRNT